MYFCAYFTASFCIYLPIPMLSLPKQTFSMQDTLSFSQTKQLFALKLTLLITPHPRRASGHCLLPSTPAGDLFNLVKKAAARVSFLSLLHFHEVLLSSNVFEKCTTQKSPGLSSGTPHFQNYTKADIRNPLRDLRSIKQALSLQALPEMRIQLHR